MACHSPPQQCTDRIQGIGRKQLIIYISIPNLPRSKRALDKGTCSLYWITGTGINRISSGMRKLEKGIKRVLATLLTNTSMQSAGGDLKVHHL